MTREPGGLGGARRVGANGRSAGSRPSEPSWRDDRVWQAGFLIGSALACRGDRRRPACRAGRPARAGRLAGGRAHRASGRLAAAPGTLDRDRAARRRSRPTPRPWQRIVPALSAALGTPLPGVVERAGVVDRAGWVRANTGSFASLIGKLEGELLDQVVPPGGGLAKASMALANRWVTTRQLGFLLGFMGTRVLGQYDLALLSAEAAPGPAAVRRGEHPGDGPRRSACRSGRSGPGSRSTRRPTPSSSRPTPGCGRTWPSASSASCRLFATDAAGPRPRGAARPRAGAPRRDRRRALDGAADGPGAAPPVPRDPGGDEPARGLQRLRHGRGRAATWSRTSSGSAPGSTSGATRRTPFERAMLRLTGLDLKMEQYTQGRAVRPGDRRRAAGPAALRPAVGRPRDAAARRRDRRRRSAGSRRVLDGGGRHDRARGPRHGPPVPAPVPAARPPRSPSARSCRPATGRATSSGSGRRRPGARIVTVSVEGLADGPLDDVEVMLRGWLSSDAFDRLLARAPRLALGPLGDVRRRPRADAGLPRARPGRHQRPRRLQPADRRVRPDDDPRGQPRLPQLLELQRERTWQPLEGARAARRDGRASSASARSGGPSAALATAFGCRVVAVRRRGSTAGLAASRARRGRGACRSAS